MDIEGKSLSMFRVPCVKAHTHTWLLAMRLGTSTIVFVVFSLGFSSETIRKRFPPQQKKAGAAGFARQARWAGSVWGWCWRCFPEGWLACRAAWRKSIGCSSRWLGLGGKEGEGGKGGEGREGGGKGGGGGGKVELRFARETVPIQTTGIQTWRSLVRVYGIPRA